MLAAVRAGAFLRRSRAGAAPRLASPGVHREVAFAARHSGAGERRVCVTGKPRAALSQVCALQRRWALLGFPPLE